VPCPTEALSYYEQGDFTMDDDCRCNKEKTKEKT